MASLAIRKAVLLPSAYSPGWVLLLMIVVMLLSACGPRLQPAGPGNTAATIATGAYIAADGSSLPLRYWPAQQSPTAVVIALHGYNDYSAFINDLAETLALQGIATYAYDQRGFGAAPHRGIWPGTALLQRDLLTLIDLLKRRHPQTPLYLLGESMGAALILLTVSQHPQLPVAGVLLCAPAVWGPSTWPWYQRGALHLGAHLLPGLSVTGKGLDITPSDNRSMLRQLGNDPLVIKHSRLDSLWGLSQLMEAALQAAPAFRARSLILLGEKDHIVPLKPTRQLLKNLPPALRHRQQIALYHNGYHMLTRDLQAHSVWQDIIAWIARPGAALPSAADVDARQRLQLLAD